MSINSFTKCITTVRSKYTLPDLPYDYSALEVSFSNKFEDIKILNSCI